MTDINDTLQGIGTGLGYLFNGIAVPLGTLVIILSIAAGIGVMMSNIFHKI